MNITLFNKYYWIRRFGVQREVKGYLVSSNEDFVVHIHVHPLGTDQQQALPEGERRLKHLEGHGTVQLLVADERLNRKGDLLYYGGEWYECKSCVLWDHTILEHYNYQFMLVPQDGSWSPDLDNPPNTVPSKAGVRP